MSPVLLLLLLIAGSTATLPDNSTGLKFIVAFPENIAYYYPDTSKNKVQITALCDGTKVDIKMHDAEDQHPQLDAGETKEFTINATVELQRQNTSRKTLHITSNKEITVQVINHKYSSVQTALLIPADKLGTEYFVPPVPSIKGTSDPADIVTTAVTERGPFKLIIVNSNQTNEVTVTGADTIKVSLESHEIAQIWVKEVDKVRTVKADKPMLVLFGHTCAFRQNCTCGLLYTVLPPATEEKLNFFIPPVLAEEAEDETFVLESKKDSGDVTAFNSNSPSVDIAGTVFLYRPGLLLALIPERDFAACSVIRSIPGAQNYAVIVVHEDFKQGVHVRDDPLESTGWTELKGTEYVSRHVDLEAGKNVIWHNSSKMAVYFVGNMSGSLFGNPAPIISTSPDFRGCILSPEVVEIGEKAGGWRESVQYCRDKGMELVSLPSAEAQRQVYDKILQTKQDGLQEVWIGMRRRSQTGEWYWLDKTPVKDTDWMEGEPGTVHEGQCALMSLKNSKDFGWGDEDCCKVAHPVCYRKPTFLPINEVKSGTTG